MSEIIDIFKTTIFKKNINNIEYKKYFIKILNQLKNLNYKTDKSNIGGFQTKSMTEIENKNILTNIFINPAKSFAKNLNIKNNLKIVLDNYWINSNNKNDYNLIHNHPNSNISGVYYISVPKLSGRLVFKNPDLTKMYGNNFNCFNDANFFSTYFVNVEEGDLYLFTSETLHYVEPNKSEKERVSVAFNLKVV
jgi:uncharacterized protein (TIGR02466 family)